MKRTLPLAAVRALYDVYDAVRVGRPADLEPVAEYDPALRALLGLPPRDWPSTDDALAEVQQFLNNSSATDGGQSTGDPA